MTCNSADHRLAECSFALTVQNSPPGVLLICAGASCQVAA